MNLNRHTAAILTIVKDSELVIPPAIQAMPVALPLPDDLSFRGWVAIGKQLRRAGRGLQWWIGDWLAFGDSHYPPENYARAVADLFDYQQSSYVRKLKWVSRAVSLKIRHIKLSWEHHVEIADKSLSDDEKEKLLDEAERTGLTWDEFRHRVMVYKRARKIAHLPDPTAWDGAFALDTINLCPVGDVELPPNSVDMIFTDPPYAEEHLAEFESLGRLARQVLKPGRYLMTYTGKFHMPDVIKILESHLEWVWCYGTFQPDAANRVYATHILQAWRPILCFKRSGDTETVEWQPDMIETRREKEDHEWQQAIAPALKWIDAYTLPGQIVLDPFIGSGTTAVACRKINRHFIAFDSDPDAVKHTLDRLDGVHA